MRKNRSLIFIVILFFLMVGEGIGGTISLNFLGKEKSLAPMLEKAIPAVVNISVSKKMVAQSVNPLFNDPFFKEMFPYFNLPERREERSTQSIGSGVIIDSEKGYIVTNHHVIEGADEIFITLKDGRRVKAKKVGSDPDTDIALLIVKEKNLVSLPFANIEKLRVGDFVIAIGNPFGLGQTVTSGIVSAVERSGLGIENYENFIQTDASINPGNSGGALINLRGELIGINTAIISPQRANVGIGFAIPVDMVQVVIKQLAERGKVKRGKIGVYIQDLTPEIAVAFRVDKNTKGALITNVIKGSPAHKAGLKQYDIVTTFNGKSIKNGASLRNFVGITPMGKEIILGIIRDRRVKTIEIKRGKVEKEVMQETGKISFKGATFANIEEDHPLFGRIKGVVVTSVKQSTKAWEKNIQKGDIVNAVNKKPVNNIDDFQKLMPESSKEEVLLTIKRKSMFIFILL